VTATVAAPTSDKPKKTAKELPPLTVGKADGPHVTFGVHVFLRGQGRFNRDYGNTADNHQGEVLERVRLQALGVWGPLSGFVQLQDARTWGFETSTITNEANTDLHQGYLEISGERGDSLGGSIRAGRQEIIWGRARMIGNLGWLPTARSFDSIRMRGSYKKLSLDLFGAIMARAQTFTYTDNTMIPPGDVSVKTAGAQLVGGQFAYHAHEAFNLEVLGLYDRANEHPNNVTLDRDIGSLGGRLWGKPLKGFGYDLEGHGQFGQQNTLQHRAFAVQGTLSYVHAIGDYKPGLRGGVAVASGGTCTDPTTCAAAESNDFFNFYPTNHVHYGIVDVMNWSNMRDIEAGLTFGYKKSVKLVANYHYFQLNNPAGRWTNAGGAQVGAGFDPTNTDRELGHEIDFVLTLKPWKPLMVQPGYGVFIPTGAGARLGGTSPQHFTYLWLVFNI
jgi:hypothetical protein